MGVRWVAFLSRLRGLWDRHAEEDLRQELQTHLELLTSEYERRGMSPAEARRMARVKFGGLGRTTDLLRDQRGFPVLDALVRDVRFASRLIAKHRWFTLVSASVLAMGIGATTAVATAIDALLLRPLPVPDPRQLVFVAPPLDETADASEWTQARRTFPYAFFERLAESDTGFSGVLAATRFPTVLAWSDGAVPLDAEFVSAYYFRVLGLTPASGRLPPVDDMPSSAVLSHRLWITSFGGRSDVIGLPIRAGGESFVITGIAPEGFAGTYAGTAPDLWLSLSSMSSVLGFGGRRTSPSVDIVGRLAPGVTMDQAAPLISGVYRRWIEKQVTPPGGMTSGVVTTMSGTQGVPSIFRDSFNRVVGLLLVVCGCLWLITCANITGLSFARLRSRHQEIGVRLTLGASRGRVAQQLLIESAMIAAFGGVLGVFLAVLLLRSVPSLLPSWSGIELRLTGTVLAVAAAASVVAALLLAGVQGLVLGRRANEMHLANRLSLGSFGNSGSRKVSNGLVVAQIALTLPLVIGAALFAQTLYHLNRAETGFGPDNLLQVESNPLMFGYSPAEADTYYARLVDRLRTLSGVAGVTTSNAGALSGTGVTIPLEANGGRHPASIVIVGQQYFETMNIPLLVGRPFANDDRREAPGVVVVNRAFAERLADDVASTLGRTLNAPVGNLTWTVIGVAASTTFNDLRDASTPIVYLPESQFDSPYLLVHVRTLGDPGGMVDVVRDAALAVDRNLPLVDVQTLAGRRRVTTERERALAVASGAVGWIALLLSAVGLYGLLAYSVVTRTREFGIRSALGARRRQVVGVLVRQTATLVGSGCALGLLATAALTDVIESQLYGVPAADQPTYVIALGTVAIAGALAVAGPLRQALHVDPMVALREE